MFFLFCKNEDNEIIPRIKLIPINAIPENTRSVFENDEINVIYVSLISATVDVISNDLFLRFFIFAKNSTLSLKSVKKIYEEYDETASSESQSIK